MAKLLQQALTPEVINQSWKRLSSDKTVWLPNMGKAEMEQNIVYHILKLHTELLNGTYRAAPTRQFTVDKANGKKRVIAALTLRDKLAQRAILTVLDPLGEKYFYHDSYGYRPGRSIDMALARCREFVLCGLPWLVDADISRFFDNIPHTPLRKELRKLINDPALLRLIDHWLDVGTPRTGIISKRRGIPQGSIISPFLCNVYLTQLDQYLTKNNLPFVRFADDFLVFTPNETAAKKAFRFVEKGLQNLDLRLNLDKSQIVYSSPKVKFLGRKLPKPPKLGIPDPP